MNASGAIAFRIHPFAPSAELAARLATSTETLAADLAAGRVAPLAVASHTEDLARAAPLAERFRREADHIVLLGTGGSSLGAQALAQLKGWGTPAGALAGTGPRFHFLDNLDGPSMSALLEALPLTRTRYLIVSKSGGTAETMMQALAVIRHLRGRGLEGPLGTIAAVITEARDQPLTRLALEMGFERLEHPRDIGGRYSVLSIVGLFPAMILGIDAARLRAGARAAAEEIIRLKTKSAVADGALFSVAAMEGGRPVQVMLPYSDRLERFAFWWRQLWAESLGKAGKGSLPVRALGPVDQHSQLQLYIGGPDLAAFTLLTEDQAGRGPLAAHSGDQELGYIAGRAIGDLVMAEARATEETLVKHQRMTRAIAIGRLSEFELGRLLGHFMLETILSARMIGVDAFDQPAVEEGKILARRYLLEARG